MTNKHERLSSFGIDPIFTARWSPRAFTGETIGESELLGLFEAARWAPSSNNSQPWRYVYARRDSAAWPGFLDLLAERNRLWAQQAAALVVLVTKTTHRRQARDDPKPLRTHALDAGASWASLAFQAVHAGWRTRAIGGFDRDRAREVLGVPAGFEVQIAIAIGRQAEAATLPDDFREQERPNQRLPLERIVAEGRFSFTE
ncbi:nitroreductase family protein [Thauera sinica]|uniref:Nitroreductase family protein n=1 Tax=Thauera sinica TaxID=2665146 RepID=A0ABW1AM43_9RHOO|nr:nitroreductase family protein [Thauera sp. K11]ATE62447.1 nitroreductase [Thauera sp. K11]